MSHQIPRVSNCEQIVYTVTKVNQQMFDLNVKLNEENQNLTKRINEMNQQIKKLKEENDGLKKELNEIKEKEQKEVINIKPKPIPQQQINPKPIQPIINIQPKENQPIINIQPKLVPQQQNQPIINIQPKQNIQPQKIENKKQPIINIQPKPQEKPIPIEEVFENFEENAPKLFKQQFPHPERNNFHVTFEGNKLTSNDLYGKNNNFKGNYPTIILKLENETIIAICGKSKPILNPKSQDFIVDEEFKIYVIAYNGERAKTSFVHSEHISYDPSIDIKTEPEILSTCAFSITKANRIVISDCYKEDVKKGNLIIEGELQTLHPKHERRLRTIQIEKIMIVTWE